MTTIGPTYRTAEADDLPAIVALLADDPLGAQRERVDDPLPESYGRAFAAIERDANNELRVAELDGQVVGVLQITFLPSLTYQGSWRAQIEGVRTARSVRGRGVGRGLVDNAIERARAAGCRLIQLTTDKARPDALRFYEALGFRASHEGMKRSLDEPR
jgi:ribosomal protein S18 acetylase RimI-like enzyme